MCGGVAPPSLKHHDSRLRIAPVKAARNRPGRRFLSCRMKMALGTKISDDGLLMMMRLACPKLTTNHHLCAKPIHILRVHFCALDNLVDDPFVIAKSQPNDLGVLGIKLCKRCPVGRIVTRGKHLLDIG